MLENMKVGAKLFVLLGLLSFLLIAVGVIGLRGIKSTDASLETVYNDRLVPITLLAQMNDLRRENIQELLLASFHDPKVAASKIHEADHPVTRHTDAVEANREKNNKLWEQYMATYLTPEEKKLADSYAAHVEKYRSEGQRPAIALLKERKFDEAGLLITNKLVPLFNESEQVIKALMQLQVDVAKAEKDKADASYASTRNLTLASIIVGILLAIGIGYWIIRSITGRLTESVSAISTSATEIAATITQHERTAAQQSAAANETSATVTELSASSRQSAEQAGNAAASAEQSSTATAQGGAVTHQTVDMMNNLKDKIAAMSEQILRLSEQTGQIGGIATLLKDLAGQINMLALNAAVEAARAGEHGKGFAVVASEIRKLADQSKKSAEQTATLVTEVQKATQSSIMMTEEGTRSVNEMTQLVQKVADLFNNLAGMADNVNENVQQVMLNAKQQSAAFGQIVEATNSIATGAKETAAGISQTKIGVQKLNEAAENLKAIA